MRKKRMQVRIETFALRYDEELAESDTYYRSAIDRFVDYAVSLEHRGEHVLRAVNDNVGAIDIEFQSDVTLEQFRAWVDLLDTAFRQFLDERR